MAISCYNPFSASKAFALTFALARLSCCSCRTVNITVIGDESIPVQVDGEACSSSSSS